MLDAVHASERNGSPDSYIAWIAANAEEAIGRDPEALRRYLDGWSDRLDPGVSWIIEQIYLRDSGQTKKLASHLVSTRDDQFNMSFAGLLMPAACRGYGRMLQGVPNAPRHGREMSETAARISRLPSREWNVALLEAQAALFSGDKKRAIDRANRALRLMTVERDSVLGTLNMVDAATVLAWAGEGDEAVTILRRVNKVPGYSHPWAILRDPLLAVPLTGNAAFEALKREVDPPG